MIRPMEVVLRSTGERSRPRVITADSALDDRMLAARIDAMVAWLAKTGIRRVASRLDNGPSWFVLDLALREVGGVHVPLPMFFSEAQMRHALANSGAQCVITAREDAMPPGAEALTGFLDGERLACWRTPADESRATALPARTACITYTSGTTGRPRGVCLDADTLFTVAASLVDAAASIAPRRHLCLMPLATLLENVAGLYATLLADAEIALPSLAEIGYTGATGLDVPTLLRCLHRYQPESVILVPQLLLALVMAAEQGAPLPPSLRYVAVGGGRVGPGLLRRARALGLPVFEGYGLTECGSVVCLNRPDALREGSVGRPLPHARVSIVEGEIQVDGARALAYLGGEPLPAGRVRTGDLGHLDDEGFVHITGRRKNVFITAFGRNVSPEWVESELLAHPAIAQAVVWGEGQADNVAVLVPRRADIDDTRLARALSDVNAGLPDYARIARFVRAGASFTADAGLLTANGRPRREAILSRYQADVDACYRRAPNVSPSGVAA
ncbi:AMP-binding protein [Pseudoxanthomonas sp.]|jgi:long-subunit acyl-CoA synthetase (AMP-forming)|uniref:AMP-binding protein n=1 Tax=Pseudoxanthomonas sp. TaxID=1871049 RepID=UPI002E152702|nr:AMP-binding protein [Pseudoxanthomonas sp.]